MAVAQRRRAGPHSFRRAPLVNHQVAKDAYPQVAAELRKMAEFLLAKADAVQALVEVKRPFADRVEAKGDRHAEIMDVKAAVAAVLNARETAKAGAA